MGSVGSGLLSTSARPTCTAAGGTLTAGGERPERKKKRKKSGVETKISRDRSRSLESIAEGSP